MLQPLRGRWPWGDDPRSRGWPGPEVLPSRCRVRESLQLYLADLSPRVKSCREHAWRPDVREPRAAGRASAAGRRRAARSPDPRRTGSASRHGSPPPPRSAAGLRVSVAGIENRKLAVPSRQGAERPGRRRFASPTPVSGAASQRCGRRLAHRGRAPRPRCPAEATPARVSASKAPGARGPPSVGQLIERGWRPGREIADSCVSASRREAPPSGDRWRGTGPAFAVARSPLSCQREIWRNGTAATSPARRLGAPLAHEAVRSCSGQTASKVPCRPRAHSLAAPAARRPAGRLEVTTRVGEATSFARARVHAVPSVATAFSNPAWARATTSM